MKKQELQLEEQNYGLKELESEVDDLFDSLDFVEIPYQYFNAHSKMRVPKVVVIGSGKVLTTLSEFVEEGEDIYEQNG